MTLYNAALYDESLYNEWDKIVQEYDTADSGVDFGDGFKLPNVFANVCMIGYLDPLNSSYSTTRVTQTEQRFTNVQKTGGEIIFTGYIQGTSRADLVEKVEYFKAKVEGERRINFKDSGVEKTAKAFCRCSFVEEKHTITKINFEVVCTALDHIAYAENIDLQYPSNTGSSVNKSFYNNGKETDFLGVLTYNTASNIDVTFSLNGIDLVIPEVSSSDIILIDTEEISVKKNGVELVFGGIISKLVPGNNDIVITDTGTSRNYDLQIFHRVTIT